MAKQAIGEQLLAIKRIFQRIAYDEEVLTILFEEALSAQRLQHRNICEIIEVGHVDATHFIVMEYISGRNLEQLRSQLFRSGRLAPIPAVLYIVSEVCTALEFAHSFGHRHEPTQSGILHHDLIPQNVCLSFDGEVKVTDFAIGRAVTFLLQGRTRVLKRRYGFMAPELVRGGKPMDHRADLFSVGVLLYELLTGARAFRGENDLTTLEKVRRGDVIRPTELRGELSPELEQVVMRAIANDADSRYQLARDLKRELLSCLSKESPSYTSRDLAQWLRELFGAEVEAEQLRFGDYAGGHIDSANVDRSSSWPPPTI